MTMSQEYYPSVATPVTDSSTEVKLRYTRLAAIVMAFSIIGAYISEIQTNDHQTQVVSDLGRKVDSLEQQVASNKASSGPEAIRSAQKEVSAERRAVLTANFANSKLQIGTRDETSGSTVLTILKGHMERTDSLGYVYTTVDNPILLSTVSLSPTYDSHGDFLVGSWIGRVSTPNGLPTIVPYGFDTAGETFIPDDTTENAVTVVNAFTSVTKSTPDNFQYGMYASDIKNNKLLHTPDGGPLMPGLSTSMK